MRNIPLEALEIVEPNGRMLPMHRPTARRDATRRRLPARAAPLLLSGLKTPGRRAPPAPRLGQSAPIDLTFS